MVSVLTYNKVPLNIRNKMSLETLRKFPPVDNLLRLTANDYKIPDSNLTIEKDTIVIIPVFGIHNDPDIYPNPEMFDPERFSDENKKKLHPMAHLPFGEF